MLFIKSLELNLNLKFFKIIKNHAKLNINLNFPAQKIQTSECI